MSHDVYRARARFQWDGWVYAPRTCGAEHLDLPSLSPDEQAKYQKQAGCRCARSVRPEIYGGDVWLVESGHPNADAMLRTRKAVYDASIPGVDELLKQDEFKRLLKPPAVTAAA